VIFFAFAKSGWGQTADQYIYSTGTGATLLTPAFTQIIAAGVNDGVSSVVDFSSYFTFAYESTQYTQFSVNSNGLMRLGGTVIGTTSANSTTGASNQPKIMPLWDDLSTASNGGVWWGISGTAPNQILVIDYKLYKNSTVASAYNCECQVWLHEGTNTIEFVYGTGVALTSYSCGIGGTTATKYQSVKVSTLTSSNSSATDNNTVWPGSGTYFLFTPPTATYRYYMYGASLGSSTWCPGESRSISIKIENTGTATWTETSPDINIGVKWNSDGTNWTDYLYRVHQSSGTYSGGGVNVPPGQSSTYTFPLMTASNATTIVLPTGTPTFGTSLSIGSNSITFDMVNEANCWFGNNPGSCGTGTATMNFPYSSSVTIAYQTSITLGTSPTICQGTTTANLPYTATTGAPTQYSITYDATAQTAGFTNVALTALPASPISLTVPAGATAGVYNGSIIVQTGSGCQSISTAFTVTVTATPSCATNLYPTTGATGISTSQVLSWPSVTNATGYDVYFGTSATPPKVTTNQAGATYTPVLAANTTYFWYVVPYNSVCGTWASGCSTPLSFTTSSPCSGYAYRSRAVTGNWSAYTTAWQVSHNGGAWANCTTLNCPSPYYPTSGNACSIEIISGSTVNLDKSISVVNTIVDNGGTLNIPSGNSLTFSGGNTLTNCGILTVSAGGTSYSSWNADGTGLIIDGTGSFINAGSGTVTVNTTGVIVLAETASGSTLINYGTINNYGGTYYLDAVAPADYSITQVYGGIFSYDPTNYSSTVTNYGTFTNNAPASNWTTHSGNYYYRGNLMFCNFNNYGTFLNNNNGVIYPATGFEEGTVNNYSGGVMTNYGGMLFGSANNYSELFNNYGTYNEYFETIIDNGSVFTNESGAKYTINAPGCLAIQRSAGTLNASGINSGTMTVASGSTNPDYVEGIYIDAHSTFTNNSVFTDAANGLIQIVSGGSFTNATGSTFNYAPTGSSITGSSLKYAGSAVLNYNGTASQTTSAMEWPTASSVPNYIQINNTYASGIGVTLDGNKSISGSLSLTNGSLFLNSHTLTVTNTATTAISRANGYILSNYADAGFSSNIKWSIASGSSYTFPFGVDVSNQVPFTFSNTGTVTTLTVSTYEADHMNTQLGGSVYGDKPTAVTNLAWIGSGSVSTSGQTYIVRRFWSITPSAGTVNASLSFSYAPSSNEDPISGYSATNTGAQYWNSPNWQLPVLGNSASRTVTVTGLASLSNPIWVLSLKSNPLPIELSSFNAVCNNNKVGITWVTASEINNNYFTIERSKDLQTWEIVTTIVGAGNSNTPIAYSYTDNNPFLETSSYYRLRQTDYNGTTVAFDPSAVKCNEVSSEISINYYPNPFNSELIISTKNAPDKMSEVIIYDIMGNKVYEKPITLENESGVFTLNLGGNISKGIYFIKFISDGYTNTSRIVKE